MIDKASIIIVTRNREKMLARCLESLVKQTHLPDEIIVVDNASTDLTKKVILSFKKSLPIRYVQEPKIGIPYARNKGLQHTTGELILMLDDDCEADKFWVEKMIEAHKRYPNAWAIQGRTNSLPKTRIYSLFCEFSRFLYVKKCVEETITVRNYFNKDFRNEMEISTCDTKNFSINAFYLKKYNLLFDKHFYRGSDTDLGEQILRKNGSIMFCPGIRVAHWERSDLKGFLVQRWHIGRTAGRIANKWGSTAPTTNTPWQMKLIAILYFCKTLGKLHKLPILISLHLLDKLFYLSGYFFEKRILTLGKQ